VDPFALIMLAIVGGLQAVRARVAEDLAQRRRLGGKP
jgi:hypothetical protein